MSPEAVAAVLAYGVMRRSDGAVVSAFMCKANAEQAAAEITRLDYPDDAYAVVPLYGLATLAQARAERDAMQARAEAAEAEAKELFEKSALSATTCIACPSCGAMTRARYLRAGRCVECIPALVARAEAGEALLRSTRCYVTASLERRIDTHLTRAAGDAPAQGEKPTSVDVFNRIFKRTLREKKRAAKKETPHDPA